MLGGPRAALAVTGTAATAENTFGLDRSRITGASLRIASVQADAFGAGYLAWPAARQACPSDPTD